MFKISGLDGLSKTLEEAARALEGIDGELGSVTFDPNDPASIENAIAEIARLVDEKLGAYGSNPIVGRRCTAGGRGVSGEIDLFKQMTNAVLDLQNAQLQSYARPLKTLARLLRHPDLAPANSALTQDLDLDAFLTESEKSQGGMMGSAELAWPESSEKMLGLTLLLIERFAENPDHMAQFGHRCFDSSSKILLP
jgi:hypothetical protein